RAIRPPVVVTGPPAKPDLEACWELGALLAAEVADVGWRSLGRAADSVVAATISSYQIRCHDH
ncbi:MAG: hypothetical protein ABSB59_27910, partial [Streptosporangiaceae bacterium]